MFYSIIINYLYGVQFETKGKGNGGKFQVYFLYILQLIFSIDFPVIGITAEKDYRAHHYTSKFQTKKNPNLFLFRRGFTVVLNIALKRAFDGERDDFTIVLETGIKPREFDRSLVVIPHYDEMEFKKKKAENQWAYKILCAKQLMVYVEVFIPSDALVARYNMSIESNEETKYKSENQVVILFNPWCEGMLDKNVYTLCNFLL